MRCWIDARLYTSKAAKVAGRRSLPFVVIAMMDLLQSASVFTFAENVVFQNLVLEDRDGDRIHSLCTIYTSLAVWTFIRRFILDGLRHIVGVSPSRGSTEVEKSQG